MTFSKEDNAAWENSEVMKELEKFADEILNPSPEPYLPIEEEKTWEEEEEPIVELSNDKEMEEDMCLANELISNLKKLAEQLADNHNIKSAYRVERTIQELKDMLEGK